MLLTMYTLIPISWRSSRAIFRFIIGSILFDFVFHWISDKFLFHRFEQRRININKFSRRVECTPVSIFLQAIFTLYARRALYQFVIGWLHLCFIIKFGHHLVHNNLASHLIALIELIHWHWFFNIHIGIHIYFLFLK